MLPLAGVAMGGMMYEEFVQVNRLFRTRLLEGWQPFKQQEPDVAVYFMQAGASSPIKIGCTADPKARLKSMQTHHFETVRLLAVAPGCRRVEAAVHELLAGSRLRGEWFWLTAEVQRLIDRINDGAHLFKLIPAHQGSELRCGSIGCGTHRTCEYREFVLGPPSDQQRLVYEEFAGRWANNALARVAVSLPPAAAAAT